MMKILLVVLCVALVAVDAQKCGVDIPVEPLILSPMPHTYIKPAAVPQNFDWRNNSGKNYCTSSRNQHIPQYCGSCWAMAATSSFADRIRIVRNSTFPDFEIAVQTLVYCTNNGCGGGSASIAYQWINQNGVGPDTCQNYVALGTGKECSAIHQCENCMGTSCWAVTDYPKFGISEFGTVLGVDQMKAEIYARGPIACYVNAGPIYDWGFEGGPYDNTIFANCSAQTNPKCGLTDHVISVVGFGFDKKANLNYWIIRNSWGEYWGDLGYARIKMGDNQLGMETSNCAWAVPTIPKLP